MDTKIADNIVNAIADGQTDIEQLLKFCTGKVKKKKAEMRKALHGVVTTHDRMMLRALQNDISHYRIQIAEIEKQIVTHTAQMSSELIANLQHVKGIGPKSTEIILAEVGDNVDAFTTADKLAAWVGLAPGNKESAGKNFYSGTRDGNKTLRTTMIQVAWAAVRTKNSYWRALYYHLTRRMPMKKAIVAVARKLMRVVYRAYSLGLYEPACV